MKNKFSVILFIICFNFVYTNSNSQGSLSFVRGDVRPENCVQLQIGIQYSLYYWDHIDLELFDITNNQPSSFSGGCSSGLLVSNFPSVSGYVEPYCLHVYPGLWRITGTVHRDPPLISITSAPLIVDFNAAVPSVNVSGVGIPPSGIGCQDGKILVSKTTDACHNYTWSVNIFKDANVIASHQFQPGENNHEFTNIQPGNYTAKFYYSGTFFREAGAVITEVECHDELSASASNECGNGKITVTFSDDFSSPCLGPPVNNRWIGTISKIGGEPIERSAYGIIGDDIIFHNLPSGTYNVNGRRESGLPGGVVCIPENATTVTIEQSAVNNTSLAGHIKNSLTDAPITDADVYLTSQYNTHYEANTDPCGNYGFGNLPLGNYTLKVTKPGFKPSNENFPVNGGHNSKDKSLDPDTENRIELTEGKLYIYADNINDDQEPIYYLSGNVNINGILYFGGNVKVDKRPINTLPVVEANTSIYAKDIQGLNEIILPNYSNLKFFAEDNDLISQTMDNFCDIPIPFAGIPLKLAGLTITTDGTEVRSHALLELPFPLNRILTLWVQRDPLQKRSFNLAKKIIDSLSGKFIYNRNSGRGFELNYSLQDTLKFTGFNINKLVLNWNSLTSTFRGGIMVEIPRDPPTLLPIVNKNQRQPQENVTIDFVNKEGELIYRSNLEDVRTLLSQQDLSFSLEFGFKLINGNLDSVAASGSGLNLPLGSTGLKITKISASIYNFSELQNIVFQVKCDIETGFEILGFAPVTLSDVGGEIAPSSYVNLSGGIKVFDEEVTTGKAEMNWTDYYIDVTGNLDILSVIIGSLNASLRQGSFIGRINGSLQTPQDFLPVWLKILGLENKTFANAEINLINEEITAQGSIPSLDFSLAIKLIYGNPVKIFVGTNLDNLLSLFNKISDNRQMISFNVPNNSSKIFLVAENGINTFDFKVIDPSGKQFDSSNSIYKKYDEVKQTVMIIDKPKSGEWNFETEQTGNIDFYPLGFNQKPTQLISNPLTQRSSSNLISLKINDYNDTVDVGVYYDNDNKNFNGALIKNFRLINNVNLNFEWLNDNIPDGEYFIYTVINDRKNARSSQYAPGSIIVNNNSFEEKPVNLSAVQNGDSIKVNWNANSSPEINFTTVMYKSVSNNSVSRESITDTNSLKLTDLAYGKRYKIWAAYTDTSGNQGNSSDTVELLYRSFTQNNPPCFISDPDSILYFIDSESNSYFLNAFDADGNTISFHSLDSPAGSDIGGNTLKWQPHSSQTGFYSFKIIATDGLSADTIVKKAIVRGHEETSINIDFNSANLFEDDNKFITVRNINDMSDDIDVSIKNKRTNENFIVNCRRVSQNSFTGEFDISITQSSGLSVQNGDTIECLYNYNGANYTNYSVYDTTVQSSDNTPPAPITDLEAISGELNTVKLQWTSTGDDGFEGEAFKYDIRYSFSPISSEGLFMNSDRLNSNIYPSPSGNTDSLIINIGELTNYFNNDTVYFSIKAEDAYQNRSVIGNCASYKYIYSATELRAVKNDIYKIGLNWTGVEPGFRKINGEQIDAASFFHYRLFRKTDTSAFVQISDTISQLSYTDNLFNNPDGEYKYCMQAIYDIGASDTVFSNSVDMDRFSEIRVFCNANVPNSNNDSINITITGLDTIYSQSFSGTTGPIGLVTFGNVYGSRYRMLIRKTGLPDIIDTITVSDSTNHFSYSYTSGYKIKLIHSGFYNTSTNKLNMRDTVKAYLRNTFSPFSIVDSSTSILDSITMYADFKFNHAPSGNYYIVLNHRNMLETWSKEGGESFVKFSVNEYDFTSAQSQAYGNNLKQIGSVFGCFAGDVNKDSFIDLTDLISVNNNALDFAAGYKPSDLNGDNITDLTDLVLVYNNSTNFVKVIRP